MANEVDFSNAKIEFNPKTNRPWFSTNCLGFNPAYFLSVNESSEKPNYSSITGSVHIDNENGTVKIIFDYQFSSNIQLFDDSALYFMYTAADNDYAWKISNIKLAPGDYIYFQISINVSNYISISNIPSSSSTSNP